MKTLHCSEDIEEKREKNITKAKKCDYKKEKAQLMAKSEEITWEEATFGCMKDTILNSRSIVSLQKVQKVGP